MAAKTRKEILEALGSYQKLTWEALNRDMLANAYQAETDRAFVVIFGSVTEDMLLSHILDHFGEISPALIKDLTRSGGALGTWAQQTNLALALGIIHEQDASDLEVFRVMRNACAHSRQPLDFNTPQLRDAIGLLFVPDIAQIEVSQIARQLLRRMLAYFIMYMTERLFNNAPVKTPVERFRGFIQELRERQALQQTRSQQSSQDEDQGPQTQGQ